MRAVVIKEFRELARDRRTLAMLVVMPVLLLVIFGYAANFAVDTVSATVVGPGASTLAGDLEAADTDDALEIVAVDPALGPGDAQGLLRDRRSDLVIVAVGDDPDAALADRIHAYLDGSNLFSAQAGQRTLMEIVATDARDRVADVRSQVEETRAEAEQRQADMERFADRMADYRTEMTRALAAGQAPPAPPSPPATAALPDLPDIEVPAMDPDDFITVAFNPDLTTSWVMVPGLIGLILTFIGTVITSIGLVREREAGTLEQLAVMPLRPAAIILGKISPYFLVALLDMIVISALGIILFDVPFVGSGWLFALAALIFLFVVLGLGVLVSTLSQTTGQAIQMAVMLVMPQVLLSGIIFPLESMAAGVRWIGYLLPLTWFNAVAQGVMLRGADLGSLLVPLGILAGQALVIFGAATTRMGWILTHGGARS